MIDPVVNHEDRVDDEARALAARAEEENRTALKKSQLCWAAPRVLKQCEPKNYDGGAVRVSSMRGHTLGYLSRADAARYCDPIQNAGGSVTCDALLRGATEGEPNVSVWLDLCEPDDIGKASA